MTTHKDVGDGDEVRLVSTFGYLRGDGGRSEAWSVYPSRPDDHYRTTRRAWCGCGEWCYLPDGQPCACCQQALAEVNPCPHCSGTGIAAEQGDTAVTSLAHAAFTASLQRFITNGNAAEQELAQIALTLYNLTADDANVIAYLNAKTLQVLEDE